MILINKKLIFSVIALIGACIFWTNSAHANTYYVRLDGGDSSQCNGTVDAPYSSSTAQACAFNHPRYALGWGCTYGGGTCVNAGVMQAGDTLFIDGDDPTNGGAQAQYEIGYDDTNNELTPGCSTSFPYDCTLGNLPAGIDMTQRTSIIGTGNHKPQLWGTQRVWQVLNADNNHIWLQNLEITDHNACAYNDPSSGCNYNGPYPYGSWAEDGIYLGGDDVNLTDVYVHGFGRYGVNTDNFGTATFTRLYVIGNGYGGFVTGTAATVSGTLTFNQPVIEWNGCVEAYPMTNNGMDNPANYSQCFGQNSGGYGDGLAFGNDGNGATGNWTIIGPGSISFNTQDGLDTLHGNATGTIQVDKMRFEGNAGNQVKINALNAYLTNSIVFGDCGWWLGSPQAYSGFGYGDVCRALGDTVLFNVTNSSTAEIYNNTIISNGNIALESSDINVKGCNSSTAIYVKNNIVLGGYAWFDDTSWNSSGGNGSTTYIYNDGSNGDGLGTCGNLTWNEDYNIVYGTKNGNQGCSGAHDQCGTNPNFASSIPMGTAGGAANTFYQGNAGASLVYLNSGSPGVASGISGLNYWNTENDYHNVVRTNPPSKGGLEINSCAVNGYGCFFNSDCCSGISCSNFVCGGTSSGGSTTPNSTNSSSSSSTSNSTAQPIVTITTPNNGSSFTPGSTVTITVAASETNGNIANVSFYYNGTNLLGSSTALPYQYIATNVQAGNYTITAVATDTNGVSVTSSPVSIIVSSSSTPSTPVTPPSSPVVTLTSPTNGSTYTSGSSVTITANASETNGNIANVSFYYNGTNLLGTSTTPPYEYITTNVQAGSYTLTAVATDTKGVSTTSSPISVTVNASPTAPASKAIPIVIVTNPTSGSNFTAGSNITITATASESNGSITNVSFYYNGMNLLGSSSTSPYQYIATNVQAGTYTVIAIATDANGTTSTSSPVSVVVTPLVTEGTPSGNSTTPSTDTSSTNSSPTSTNSTGISNLSGSGSSNPSGSTDTTNSTSDSSDSTNSDSNDSGDDVLSSTNSSDDASSDSNNFSHKQHHWQNSNDPALNSDGVFSSSDSSNTNSASD